MGKNSFRLLGLFLLSLIIFGLYLLVDRFSSKQNISNINNNLASNEIELSLQSKVPNVDIAISSTQKEALFSFLTNWGLFSENGVTILGTNNWMTVKKLSIILKDNLENPLYQITDGDNNLWSAVQIEYPSNDEVSISVFRKDWNEYSTNLLINDALLRISKNTQKAFDIKLDDSEIELINRVFFNIRTI